MTTDRSLISVSDLVRKATAIVDPRGEDPAVVEFDGAPPERVRAWLSERGVELT